MFPANGRSIRKVVSAFTLAAVVGVTSAPQAVCQDEGAPPWGDWLQNHWKNDRLLKDPFRMHPEEVPKGLASKLRARELDIGNRIDAIQYLARFHCGTFPEARDMIVDAMQNDKWEPVRWAAVAALCQMCQNCAGDKNGSCNGNCNAYGTCNGTCNGNCNGNCNAYGSCSSCGSSHSYGNGNGNGRGNGKNGRDDKDGEDSADGAASLCESAQLVDEFDRDYWKGKIEKKAFKGIPRISFSKLVKMEMLSGKDKVPSRYIKGIEDHYSFAQIPEILADPKQALLYGHPDPGGPKHCSCCCDEKVMNALAKIAYEIKPDGCCFEPSRRVRQAAVEAIRASGVPCCYQPYKLGDEMGPPAFETDGSGQNNGGEVVPPPEIELTPAPTTDTGRLAVPMVLKQAPAPIGRLEKVCLVSLKQGRNAVPDQQFASEYRGRIYHFASEAALAEFERAPQDYAVAFGGCDPVHFVETRQVVEGRFLVLHNGRFYMFATQKNFENFKADIARYTGGQADNSELALASPGH
ncbi:MAG: YHS domain-containing protein [Fuerstiella sp.]